MRCPSCGHEWIHDGYSAAGQKGGAARGRKGFADPRVLSKALATRKANRSQTGTLNAGPCPDCGSPLTRFGTEMLCTSSTCDYTAPAPPP